MSAGTASKQSSYLENLKLEIAERFDRAHVPDAKTKAGLTLDQQAEILFNVAAEEDAVSGLKASGALALVAL